MGSRRKVTVFVFRVRGAAGHATRSEINAFSPWLVGLSVLLQGHLTSGQQASLGDGPVLARVLSLFTTCK